MDKPMDPKPFLERDAFARHCGIDLIELSPGRAVATLAITQDHLNGLGVTHGGAIFTLADLAFAAASNSHESLAMAINVSISYLKAASEGNTLTAVADEVTRGRKIATYAIRVTDERDDLVATFQGMVYRKKPDKK